MRPVLLDTGAIVAMLDRSEKHHSVCAEIVGKITAPLVTCEAVIAESCYLLRGLAGAAEAVLEMSREARFKFHSGSRARLPKSNASSTDTRTARSIWLTLA